MTHGRGNKPTLASAGCCVTRSSVSLPMPQIPRALGHTASQMSVSAPAYCPEACSYGKGGVEKLPSHCSWKASNSEKRAGSPIKIHTFFFLPLTFLNFWVFFPATVIILRNTNPSHCYQQRGFTVLWRTILKVQITWPKDSPWSVSAVHYVFTLPNLYLAHAKEHLTFKDPVCTSFKCLHPLLLD